SKPPIGVRHFDDGGYTVFRPYVKNREIMLVMDHGPLGYLSIAAHGHADALSVWLHVDGQPVFVDAGSHLYHSAGISRDYFRSTPAHNTLCIADTSASTPAGNFNWSHKANVRVLSKSGHEVLAEHDGYKKKFGITHQRRLQLTENGFTIEDMLQGG